MSRRPLATGSEWTFELIEAYDRELARLAAGHGLDTYPSQIEIISAEQMMDAYASVGMPVGYHHWSFGKRFLDVERRYKRGQMGLAYEIVINSDPCIAYLMEENSMMMQILVLAHAAYGHNSFFKNNYLFRQWTAADAIIDYLVFAKNYIARCEQKYGVEAVEEILDACHALMNHGVDRYKRPQRLSLRREQQRQRERAAHIQSQINELWRTLPQRPGERETDDEDRYPAEPQENLLYFVEKNAPLLEPWEREIVRIVRKLAQYFYPQRQTQVMNEGWATFWHYTLVNELYDEGLIGDGYMLEFLTSHTNVIAQPPYHAPHYHGINPYALGFAIFRDLKRICEAPDDEDRHWFPEIAGSDWHQTLDFAMRNFKDESFIRQYLSPKVIRDLKLFSVIDDDRERHLEIGAIHNEAGYREVRRALAEQYELGAQEPNIQVVHMDRRGDRSLTLRHQQYHRRPLEENDARRVLHHLARLWGFPVRLEVVDENGNVESLYDGSPP